MSLIEKLSLIDWKLIRLPWNTAGTRIGGGDCPIQGEPFANSNFTLLIDIFSNCEILLDLKDQSLAVKNYCGNLNSLMMLNSLIC